MRRAPHNGRMVRKSPLDPLLVAADRALRSVFGAAQASRPLPEPPPEADTSAAMSTEECRVAAGLMRVNHAGEVAAQALYHGQSMLARSDRTRELLEDAAREEADHLAWCERRLTELGSRPSLLNPVWYAGSFAIGALAAAVSDRTSLGFVAETERQVEHHLSGHLDRLPRADTRSRAIVEQMRHDESGHGDQAKRAGAAELPAAVRAVMRGTARVMTGTAYWI